MNIKEELEKHDIACIEERENKHFKRWIYNFISIKPYDEIENILNSLNKNEDFSFCIYGGYPKLYIEIVV